MKELFDHIRYGSQLKHYVYPPSVVPDTEGFEDALREMIPKKLKEILHRCRFLVARREAMLKIVIQKTKPGSLDEWFITTFAMSFFSEYFVIQKWINYWLSLWHKATNKTLPVRITTRLNRIEDWEREKARQNPVQNHFEGRLRKVGSRLVGLCPFHQEKTPSFTIFPDNHWYCFGACQEGGDVIKFIMNSKGLSFLEAVRYLL